MKIFFTLFSFLQKMNSEIKKISLLLDQIKQELKIIQENHLVTNEDLMEVLRGIQHDTLDMSLKGFVLEYISTSDLTGIRGKYYVNDDKMYLFTLRYLENRYYYTHSSFEKIGEWKDCKHNTILLQNTLEIKTEKEFWYNFELLLEVKNTYKQRQRELQKCLEVRNDEQFENIFEEQTTYEGKLINKLREYLIIKFCLHLTSQNNYHWWPSLKKVPEEWGIQK